MNGVVSHNEAAADLTDDGQILRPNGGQLRVFLV